MYHTRTNLLLGFHGCDETIRDNIVNGKIPFKPSNNSYDWLGNGMYFWENNLGRAYEWAIDSMKNPQNSKQVITKPAVLGAVISLGYCYDLLDSDCISELQTAYKVLSSNCIKQNKVLVTNKFGLNSTERLIRVLDCAVIETLHTMRQELGYDPYDSVRAAFFEGNEAYPSAGFHEKNHIQICIRNPNCIKGFFIPLLKDERYKQI